MSKQADSSICAYAYCSHEQTGYEKHFFITPASLLQHVQKLDELGYFLEDITCMQVKEGFLLTYHFNRWEKPGRLALRVLVVEEDKTIDSISSIYPGALWHERECYDFFGIVFKNHPSLIPLLLPPEMEERPLLKSSEKLRDLYELLPGCEQVLHAPRDEEFGQFIKECSQKGK
ncbi:MAG: NADH-quinone oxidoreductase subunit [Desulfonauticus sp.]|jgi:NADH-quinone oxidoreductase subunit C|nr:MAG: NADH dehydrogenase (Ubiquinone) 30 kDa subunit [Desulfonauticus sp. 38_4375]MDK2921032.1 NADH-quinone oxidoreductase subunit [Desulfonauticus sp.]